MITTPSPFPKNIYFILNMKRFLAIFGDVNKMEEHLVWLPTWYQAIQLCRQLNVSNALADRFSKGEPICTPIDELMRLYGLIANKLGTSSTESTHKAQMAGVNHEIEWIRRVTESELGDLKHFPHEVQRRIESIYREVGKAYLGWRRIQEHRNDDWFPDENKFDSTLLSELGHFYSDYQHPIKLLKLIRQTGLLGTGHCIGMCGPLVVALPGQTGRFSAHLAYHSGRLVTYAIIGAAMGAAGSGLIYLASTVGGNPLVWMTRVQVSISLLAGLFLLFFGLSRLGFVVEPQWVAIAVPNRMPGWRRLMSRPAAQRSNLDLFIMGLMLGSLPCGLSYAAFAKSLSGAQSLSGAAMALIFGLGTLPGLLAVGAGAAVLMNRFRQQADMLAGLIMIGMAASLLVKAMEAIV